jgi:uncharacterized membrane protein
MSNGAAHSGRRRRRTRVFLIWNLKVSVCLAGIGAGLSALGQPTKEDFQDVGYSAPGNDWWPSRPHAIGDDGAILGDYVDFNSTPSPGRALGPDGFPLATSGTYVFSGGHMTKVKGPLWKGDAASLIAINASGQMLLAQDHGGFRYFLCEPGKSDLTPIGLIGQIDDGGTIKAIRLRYLTGLSTDGKVYGIYNGNHGPCAVVGAPTLGVPGDLGPAPTAPATYTLIGCPGGGNTRIHGINAKGQIAGSVNSQGFIWSNGKLSTFSFPGAVSTAVEAINDAGVVVGFFEPGNVVGQDGVVQGYLTAISAPPQKGFVYDGTTFKFVSVPGGQTWTYATAINNTGRIAGYYHHDQELNHAFAIDIAKLPTARELPTPAELNEAASASWLGSIHSGEGRAAFDAAYRILQEACGQPVASTLRAVQALSAEDPALNLVQLPLHPGDLGYGPNFDAGRRATLGETTDLLLEQFALAQRHEKGAEAVVAAVGALTGAIGVADLRAAGDLDSVFGPERRNMALGRAFREARGRLKQDIDAAFSASGSPASFEMPPGDLGLWQPAKTRPEQMDELRAAMNTIKEQLGNQAAVTFLAWEVADMESDFFDLSEEGPLHNFYHALQDNLSQLFGNQVAAYLINLETQGKGAEAERALRVFANSPEPEKCKGMGELKASGTYAITGGVAKRDADEAREYLIGALAGIASAKINKARVAN